MTIKELDPHLFVGIDVSKKTYDACIMDLEGNKIAQKRLMLRG